MTELDPNVSLRTELTRILQGIDLEKHSEQIAELRAAYPNSVEIVQLADLRVDFNCVMFALELIGSVEPPCSVLGRYHMDTNFLLYLIQEGYLLLTDKAKPGALAIYSGNGEIRHVGIVLDGGRIRSKWGVGHIYEHGVWEVPDTFGGEIRYFDAINPDKAFALFRIFKGWES